MQTAPIGVIDSGLGGVSTLRQLCARFPHERFLYFGDCANAPYGSRTPDEIRSLALSACKRMEESGAKALVIACNTSVSVALPQLRQALHIPVVGIRPAVFRASRTEGSGRILMLATIATASSSSYRALCDSLPAPARVVSIGCPAGVVGLVERGVLDADAYAPLFDSVLSAYHGARFDAVVLGCTHYPFAADAIRAYTDAHFSGDCTFIEGGREVCDALEAVLKEDGLARQSGDGDVTFTFSGDKAKQLAVCRRLMEIPFPAM